MNLLLFGIIVILLNIVLRAISVKVDIELVVPIHVVALILEVGFNKCVQTDNKVTVALLAATHGGAGAALFSGAETEDDRAVFLL